MLGRILASSRYIVFIAVVATLVSSLALMLYEAMVVAEVAFDAIQEAGSCRWPARASLSG
jgi:uncharacterized membrane protein YqhA